MLESYEPRVNHLLDRYKLCTIANAVVFREYFLLCYESIPRWTDELHVLMRAAIFHDQLDKAQTAAGYARLSPGVIQHSTYTTTRADGGGKIDLPKLDLAKVNMALNNAWLAGELDIMSEIGRAHV